MSVQLNTSGGNIYQPKENSFNSLERHKDVIYNVINVSNALSTLKEYISGYLEDTPKRISLVHMFGFHFENKDNWKIEAFQDNEDPNRGEHFYCFKRGHQNEVLEIIKDHIETNFKDKIQEIKSDDKFVHITWKS